MSGKRKQIDWESIEKEYRLGQKSMRTIADEFGVNVSNISRRAKSGNWVQDKTDEVRQRTNAALVAQRDRNTPTREDVDLAVRTRLEVIRGHQKRIKSEISIVKMLEEQLADVVANRDRIASLIIEDTMGECGGKPNLKQRNAMMKAVALPTNASVLRDLSMALKNLVPLERQAFNLDEDRGNDDRTIKVIYEDLKAPISGD